MSAAAPFTVTIAKMVESHQTTHWVRLTNNAQRPANPSLFDETGVMHAGIFHEREHAVHTALEWATFLGVEPPEPCNCILCTHLGPINCN